MEKIEEKVVVDTAEKLPKSKSKWAKKLLMLLLIVAALFLEVYGFEYGYLRYMGVVMILLVIAVGLEGFTNSYNQLLQAQEHEVSTVRNRLKLSAEKAAAIGVVSLTLGVALGLYSFDAVNVDANSKNGEVRMQCLQVFAKALALQVTARACTINSDGVVGDYCSRFTQVYSL